MAYYRKRKRSGRKPKARKRHRKKRNPSSRTGFLKVRATELKDLTLPIGITDLVHQEAFRIADIPSILSYTPLFDQYRIKKVNIKLFPTTRTDATQNNRMTFCSSIDLDGGPVAVFSQLTECSNAKLSCWAPDVKTSQKSITVYPRFKNVIVKDVSDPQNILYSATLGRKGAWIDLADKGQTVHYGVNMGWLATTNGSLNFAEDVQFIITYDIEFRKIR